MYTRPYSAVFAPTNDTFAAFLVEFNMTVDEVFASPNLRPLLADHVIAG